MIFEDIANVMNARPVKEIMRKTGLTKNRVYSLRMGCTFHMDYELLFALQRMGYEVRVFAVGAEDFADADRVVFSIVLEVNGLTAPQKVLLKATVELFIVRRGQSNQ